MEDIIEKLSEHEITLDLEPVKPIQTVSVVSTKTHHKKSSQVSKIPVNPANTDSRSRRDQFSLQTPSPMDTGEGGYTSLLPRAIPFPTPYQRGRSNSRHRSASANSNRSSNRSGSRSGSNRSGVNSRRQSHSPGRNSRNATPRPTSAAATDSSASVDNKTVSIVVNGENLYRCSPCASYHKVRKDGSFFCNNVNVKKGKPDDRKYKNSENRKHPTT